MQRSTVCPNRSYPFLCSELLNKNEQAGSGRIHWFLAFRSRIRYFSSDPDLDPDPTCNNGNIKYFHLEQNINHNLQIQA